MLNKTTLIFVLLFSVYSSVSIGNEDSSALNLPSKLMSGISLTQKMNAQVPPALTFRDENGTRVSMSQYFGKRPLLLQLAYYKCPNICTMSMTGVLKSLEDVKLNAGTDYELLFVSIDPSEKPVLAEGKKINYLRSYPVPGAENAIHFLTGEEHSIRALADSVGYQYKYDAENQQYAHPATLIVLTPSGHVSKYLNGVDYRPRDVRLALVEASENKIGTAVDQFLLFCFHYDPVLGKYGPMVMNLVRLFGAITVAGLIILIFSLLRADRIGRLRRKRDLLAESR